LVINFSIVIICILSWPNVTSPKIKDGHKKLKDGHKKIKDDHKKINDGDKKINDGHKKIILKF
jgi:uncharacterized phage infection (PIP) family protein YhgE